MFKVLLHADVRVVFVPPMREEEEEDADADNLVEVLLPPLLAV